MSVGNDAWKGVVELGVESSHLLVERRIQEFRARKVKAMNDTDDEVVDGVVIFSNERFTREIEIGRDSSLFLSLPLSLRCIFRSKYRRETSLVLQRIPTIYHPLPVNSKNGRRRRRKKILLDARPPKFCRKGRTIDTRVKEGKGKKKGKDGQIEERRRQWGKGRLNNLENDSKFLKDLYRAYRG